MQQLIPIVLTVLIGQRRFDVCLWFFFFEEEFRWPDVGSMELQLRFASGRNDRTIIVGEKSSHIICLVER